MPASARKILPEDILSDPDYEKTREDLRKSAIALKKNRRVEVGPFATFYFENYQTMWLQVMEMLRIEKGGPGQIRDELDAYNPLIPQGDELIATLMLEIEDAARRNQLLPTLGGIEESVFMTVGSSRVHARPTEYGDRTNADGKTSSVHWLRFKLGRREIAHFASDRVAIVIEHKNYGHIAVLSDLTRRALAQDFAR